MIGPVEHFFRRTRRRISRSEWAIRRWRLPISENTGLEPGLLVVQIDGLSRRELERAIKRRRMPYLRRLQRREHYDLRTFYSGIPSSTPAVQGELFYGVKCAVPAFSFLDRAAKRVATMFYPDWAKSVEARLQEKGGGGLLEGGSSWSNIFTGGAALEESHFCAASIGWGDMLKSASIFSFFSALLLHIPSALRMLSLLFVEFFIALWDATRGVFRGENFFKEFTFVFPRVFVAVGIRELITTGAKIDLARGLPIVHVNFLGYDEQAHRRGPGSPFARWSLKGIDYAIERLAREAHRSPRRDYQVWIYSDHGQETTTPFRAGGPEALEELLGQCLDQFKESRAARPRRAHHRHSRAYWGGGRRAQRRLAERSEIEALTPDEEKSFVVTSMGPVAHLYLAEPLGLKERRELAGRLLRAGIPGVLYKTGPGHAEWLHADGVARLPGDADDFLPHPGRMKREVARDLVGMCECEDAGDLVLLGWTPKKHWTFPLERGSHAGPGLDEVQGFALLPAKTHLPEGAGEFIRPLALRAAILNFLGRKLLPPPGRALVDSRASRFRVMTYNVHGCLGMDGRISPRRIARVIRMNDPDVVALQEIDLGRARSLGHDQARMIAQELGMHAYFCPTVICGEEHYGHAILSHFPLEIIRIGRLPGCPWSPKREPRGALWARVQIDGSSVHLISTHLGLGRLERAAQVFELLGENWVRAIKDEPVILCGDFNMMPDSMPYKAVALRLHDVQRSLKDFQPLKTFAAFYPFSRIDHIFVTPHFKVEKVRVPKNHLTRVASDHLPLIADLRLQPHTAAAPNGKGSSTAGAVNGRRIGRKETADAGQRQAERQV